MSLSVTLLSGPRRSGKSKVADLLVEEVFDRRPHYVRLSAVNGGKRPPVEVTPPAHSCGVATAQWFCYESERIFELLPTLLAAIHKRDRTGQVIIEADADPALRHAYPYDRQLFVMRAPQAMGDVFRSSIQAARALQDVLDDTAEFAAEVFGVDHGQGYLDDDTREDRDLLSKTQIRMFLDSPLGDQLATRIQLRPEFHGAAESDLILVNTATGTPSTVVGRCCRRLEQMLASVSGSSVADRSVLRCDPQDPSDPGRDDLVETLRTLCR
ncbi:MAG: hypothetical protein GY842_06775 [bacterium]|nr:hypothetical protein [bacterium]